MTQLRTEEDSIQRFDNHRRNLQEKRGVISDVEAVRRSRVQVTVELLYGEEMFSVEMNAQEFDSLVVELGMNPRTTEAHELKGVTVAVEHRDEWSIDESGIPLDTEIDDSERQDNIFSRVEDSFFSSCRSRYMTAVGLEILNSIALAFGLLLTLLGFMMRPFGPMTMILLKFTVIVAVLCCISGEFYTYSVRKLVDETSKSKETLPKAGQRAYEIGDMRLLRRLVSHVSVYML